MKMLIAYIVITILAVLVGIHVSITMNILIHHTKGVIGGYFFTLFASAFLGAAILALAAISNAPTQTKDKDHEQSKETRQDKGKSARRTEQGD